jgi:hypothetical protein
MLKEGMPGGRILSLRRRRSRLPWIYSVYHAGRITPTTAQSNPCARQTRTRPPLSNRRAKAS